MPLRKRRRTRNRFDGELLRAIRLLAESLTALSKTGRLHLIENSKPPVGCNRCFAETPQRNISTEGLCPKCKRVDSVAARNRG